MQTRAPNRRTDLLLIKPGSQRQLYGELSDHALTAIEPPLWGALLAASLRQQGYGVELLDAEVEELSWGAAARRAAALDPLLCVVMVSGTNPSASTMNMTGAGEILRQLKARAPGVRTALCGLHPSALPQRTLEQEEGADHVIQGEGLHTLAPLLEQLRSTTSGHQDPRAVAGLWSRAEGGSVAGPAAAVWADLDRLPAPAWDLLPMERYRAHNWHCFDDVAARQPYAVIYTSLGCPFRCSFCCINALFGKRGIRYRSPDLVVREIDHLVQRWGIRNIKIIDEMFALKQAHVHRLCELLAERDYGLNIWAYARVNTVDAPMLAAMKRAGINWVAYGFESGSARVLADVDKAYDLGQVNGVVRMTEEQGLQICANYVFGLPEDDQESMQQTLDMALEINAAWANIYSAMAYPGSALYDQALREGQALPASWQGYSQYAYESLPLPTRHLSGGEVLAFRDHAFHAYHEAPAYLAKIERLYGGETVAHIRQMSARRLRRRYAAAAPEVQGGSSDAATRSACGGSART